MELDNRSIIIDIPKVSVKSFDVFLKKKSLQDILKRTKSKLRKNPSEMSLKKYLIDDHPMKSDNFRKEELLLPCIMYTKKQERDKNRKRLKIKITERYKVSKTDLQKRLYVENPSNEICAVTDLDEGFFNYVNDRPIKDRVPLYKSLKLIVNNLVRVKQEIGYRNDTILNIDINYQKELDFYNISVVKCMEQAKYFDEFISEDYQKSMGFLNKWDKLKIKLEDKMSELHNLANDQFTIISRLMGLDYLYSLQQKYGRFLYYLSPPSWRSKNREFARSVEIEAKGFDLGQSSEEDTFKVVFGKMQKECSGNLVEPVLYFTHPLDLINIFNAIEKQQLHHFSYVTHLAPPKKMLKEGIKSLKDIISHESASVANTIRGFEKLLEFSDERCTQLKSRFFTILNGLFYVSVGAPEVLKLFVHLEFCYERVYAEKPINMDIVTMAKALEDFYMDYTHRLDELHNENVKCAVSQCIQAERRKIKKAKNASRELRLFNRLEKELQRAFSPIGEKYKTVTSTEAKITNTCMSIKGDIFKPKVNVDRQKLLNESEMAYLTLFTEWTEGENPNIYIHRSEEAN